MKAREFAFFRAFLTEFAESMYVLNMIDWQKCRRLKSLGNDKQTRGYAETLFANGVVEIPELKTQLSLKTLKEINGTDFDIIQVLSLTKKERPRRLCFLG